MRKTKKEYQHYVPKFYLRYFSRNEKYIGTYIQEKEKFIDKAPLDSVGGKKFLYGDDGKIEDWFSKLESIWSKLFNRIIDGEKIEFHSNEEVELFLAFIFLSDARNLELEDGINEFLSNLKTISKENNPYIQELNSINPYYFAIGALSKALPLMFDLACVLIKNDSSNQLVTTDFIVTKYNPYLIEKGYKFGYGYAAIGLICFLPISPKLCICLYDDKIYDCKIKNGCIHIKNPNIINKLNQLFVFNSKKYIFYNENVDRNRLNTILKDKERSKVFGDMLFESEDGQNIIRLAKKSINKNFNIDIFKIKNKVKNIKINLNESAPQRPSAYINEEEYEIPQEILSEINGKIFKGIDNKQKQ